MRNSEGSQPLACWSIVLRPVEKDPCLRVLGDLEFALLIPADILGEAFSVMQ